jgi:hypothetical protein
MNKSDHLLMILSEECTEVMETLIDGNFSQELEIEDRDIIATMSLINQNNILPVPLSFMIDGGRTYFKDELESVENDIHKSLLKIQYYISKSLRFGVDDTKPNSKNTNAEELAKESQFLSYHIQTLFKKHNEINYENLFDKEAISIKQNKVLKYMDYSISRGTLVV